jgi:hypothetical protein
MKNMNLTEKESASGVFYIPLPRRRFQKLGWAALPFAITQTGAIDRNIYTATADGALDLYLEAKSVKGF